MTTDLTMTISIQTTALGSMFSVHDADGKMLARSRVWPDEATARAKACDMVDGMRGGVKIAGGIEIEKAAPVLWDVNGKPNSTARG